MLKLKSFSSKLFPIPFFCDGGFFYSNNPVCSVGAFAATSLPIVPASSSVLKRHTRSKCKWGKNEKVNKGETKSCCSVIKFFSEFAQLSFALEFLSNHQSFLSITVVLNLFRGTLDQLYHNFAVPLYAEIDIKVNKSDNWWHPRHYLTLLIYLMSC